MSSVMELFKQRTGALWDAYNEHPFVKGIENGDLDKDKFRFYVIQDYLYLIEYSKVFAIGVAKAKTIPIMRLFSEEIHFLIDGEMDLHRGYMGKFGITQEDLDKTPRSLDNLSYTSYMLRVAYEEGEAEILAAILSCAFSYEVIAKKIYKRNPKAIDHPFYGDWVRCYIDEGFCKINQTMIDRLEFLTRDYTQVQLDHLVDIFENCSRYEMLFWDLGWQMKL